jgi:hypothetical protein
MSVEASRYVWGLDLDSRDKMVALCIADHYNNKEGCAWPSTRTIEQRTGLSRRTVFRSIAALIDEGVITADNRHRGNGSQQSNAYRFPGITSEARATQAQGGVTGAPLEPLKNQKPSETNVSDSPEPKKDQPRGKSKGKPHHGPVIGVAKEAWNKHRHPSWPEIDKITTRGIKYIRQFWEYFDGDTEKACEMMELAIAWAAEKEDWWRTAPSIPTFDQWAAKNKLEGYAQKALHEKRQQEEKASPSPERDPYLGKTVPHKLGYLVILKEVDVPGYRYWGEFVNDEFGTTDPPEPMWVYAHDLEEAS